MLSWVCVCVRERGRQRERERERDRQTRRSLTAKLIRFNRKVLYLDIIL